MLSKLLTGVSPFWPIPIFSLLVMTGYMSSAEAIAIQSVDGTIVEVTRDSIIKAYIGLLEVPNSIKLEDVQRNADRSVTLIKPQILFKGNYHYFGASGFSNSSSAEGVCRLFGYPANQGMPESRRSYEITGKLGIDIIQMQINGTIEGLKDEWDYFASVNCKGK